MSAHSFRYALEYALAKTALAIVPRLRRQTVVRLANISGTVAVFFAREQSRVALANLDIAFGEKKTRVEKVQIVRRSFQTFALTLLDMFWFASDTAKRTRKWVVFGPGYSSLFQERAQICVTAHMGNWEVLGMAFSVFGFPLSSVAAPLANRKIDRLFIEIRKKTGQQILSKHGAVRGMLKTLKGGGRVALVLDQNTKPSAGGIFVDFFGVPAPVSPVVASLALRTGAEIYIGIGLPDVNGRYYSPSLEQIAVPAGGADRQDTERELTVSIMKNIEQLLLKYPEYWLWMYKRWKYIQPGTEASRYPYYAKQLSQRDLAAYENTVKAKPRQPA